MCPQSDFFINSSTVYLPAPIFWLEQRQPVGPEHEVQQGQGQHEPQEDPDPGAQAPSRHGGTGGAQNSGNVAFVISKYQSEMVCPHSWSAEPEVATTDVIRDHRRKYPIPDTSVHRIPRARCGGARQRAMPNHIRLENPHHPPRTSASPCGGWRAGESATSLSRSRVACTTSRTG